eukprot:2857110-Pyramimonas_sp.AAC.1
MGAAFAEARGGAPRPPELLLDAVKGLVSTMAFCPSPPLRQQAYRVNPKPLQRPFSQPLHIPGTP